MHGGMVPLRGVPHRIVHRRGVRGTVWTRTDASGEPLLCVAGDAPHIDRRISDFLRREAKRELETASRRFAADLGVTVSRVAVRDQSSRWGSCSTTGMLSFSWRLILAPQLRAQLSRRARGRAPRRDESLAAILAAGATPLPGSRARESVARCPWQRSASLRPAGSRRRPELTQSRCQWLVVVFTATTSVDGETRPNDSFVATTTSVPASTRRSIRSGVRTAA